MIEIATVAGHVDRGKQVVRLAAAMRATVTGSAVAVLMFWSVMAERVLFASLVLTAACVAGRVLGGRARAAVLTITYVFPVIAVLVAGASNDWTDTVWKLTLLGLLIGMAPRIAWSMPGLWTVTLGTWALTVALCWPIIVLRELDYSPDLFIRGEYSISTIGWIASVAATHLIGFLWIDSLFATAPADADGRRKFGRTVIMPMLIGAMASGAIALWQLVVDIGFLNTRSFTFLQRASGGMRDANAYGTMAALWTCGAMAIALKEDERRSTRMFALAAAVVCAIGLWASGSRTALLAALCGLLWIAASLRHIAHRYLGRPAALVAVAGAVIVIVVARGQFLAIGPVARAIDWLPTGNPRPFAAAMEELWNRNWYGPIAVAMIRDSPLVGVGVGSFHSLAPPYADRLGHGPLPPDNAQNWARHQLAEFGLLGSAGWIVWTAIFVVLLVRDRNSRDPVASAAVKGALIGLGVASLFGMPTQNPAVLLTFWTFVYWFASGRSGDAVASTRSVRWLPRLLVGGCALAVLCAGLSAYVGWVELRPPLRAMSLGFDYDYGFYDPEVSPEGETVRWTAQRSVVVMPAPTRWIRMSFMVNHPDLSANPVDVRLRRNSQLILRKRLRGPAPTVVYVQVPAKDPRVMLETWVSRVARPSDYGMPDRRVLGLLVHWDFVDAPGANGEAIEASRGEVS